MDTIKDIYIYKPERFNHIKIQEHNDTQKGKSEKDQIILPLPFTRDEAINNLKVFTMEVGANSAFHCAYLTIKIDKVISQTNPITKPALNDPIKITPFWGWGIIENNEIKWFGWFSVNPKTTKAIPNLKMGPNYTNSQFINICLDDANMIGKKFWIECFNDVPEGLISTSKGFIFCPVIRQNVITNIYIGPKDAGENKAEIYEHDTYETFNKLLNQQNNLNGIKSTSLVYKYGENLSLMVEYCLMEQNQSAKGKIKISVKECKYIDQKGFTPIDDFSFFSGTIEMKFSHKTADDKYPIFKGTINIQPTLNWREAGTHPQQINTTRLYMIEVDFDDLAYKKTNKNNQTLKWSEVISIYYKGDDAEINALQVFNEQMVKVFDTAKQPIGTEPCRFSRIQVSAPNTFNYLFEDANESVLYDLTNEEIQIVAGASEKSSVKLKIELIDLKLLHPNKVRCLLEPAHEIIPIDLQKEVKAITHYKEKIEIKNPVFEINMLLRNFKITEAEVIIVEKKEKAENEKTTKEKNDDADKKEQDEKVDKQSITKSLSNMKYKHEIEQKRGEKKETPIAEILRIDSIADNSLNITVQSAGFSYLNLVNPITVISKYLFFQELISTSFSIGINTCRYHRVLNFRVVQDLKWIFTLNFNNGSKILRYNTARFQSKIIEPKDKNSLTAAEKLYLKKEAKNDKLNNIEQSKVTNLNEQYLPAEKQTSVEEKHKPKDKKFEFKASLEAQWNGGQDAVEFEKEYFEHFFTIIKQLYGTANQIRDFFSPSVSIDKIESHKGDNKLTAQIVKETEEKQKKLREKKDAENNIKKIGKLDESLAASKPREVNTYRVLYPNIGLTAAWYLSTDAHNGNAAMMHKTQAYCDIKLIANPLIGFEYKLDFIGLIQNSNPIAFVIIRLMDMTSSPSRPLGFRIDADLTLTANFNVSVEDVIRLNGLNKLLDKNDNYAHTKNTAKAEVTGKLAISLHVKFQLKINIKGWVYNMEGNLIVNMDLAAEVSLTAHIGSNDLGIFLQPELTFSGLILTVTINASFKGKGKYILMPHIDVSKEWKPAPYTLIEPGNMDFDKCYITNNY